MGVDAIINFTSPTPITPEELKLAGYDLAAALPSLFARARRYNKGRTITAKGDYYAVDIWARYYGPNYERGPFPEIYTAILWLKRRFPNIKVYYYGDSSCLSESSEMTEEALAALMVHWLDNGNQPYQRFFGGDEIPPKGCEQCARPLINVGGGGGDKFLSCMACERRFIETSNKDLIPVEEFFTREPQKPL